MKKKYEPFSLFVNGVSFARVSGGDSEKELVRPVWAMQSLSIKIKKRDLLFLY